ncbi:MAG: hypothetical protein ACI9W6_000538 [Motiliproteus sp.]|jgi:hypothetical protein
MATTDKFDQALFEGLQSLSESAFPKHCGYCGRTFDSAAAFVKETEKLPRGTGLKASWDDDDQSVVELYRNCVCGSTLMSFFADRRGACERGFKRRERFGNLMAMLEEQGLATAQARRELKKLLRGERSEALEALGLRARRLGVSAK